MKNVLIIVFIFITSINNAQDFVYDYIEQYKDIAIEEMNKTGIPASITLAQGMLESNWGRSELSRDANNHFGIKCGGNWTGETFSWEDDEYKHGKLVESCFRVYSSAEESFIDHSDFLANKKRYKFLFDYDVTDYNSWAKGLVKAGYATDPKYAGKLSLIIEKYGLYEFDIKYNPIEYVASNKKTNIQKAYTIALINKAKVVYSKKGDTPMSLAKKLGVSTKKILKYNETIKRKHQKLKEGEIVYLTKKKRRYYNSENSYIASRGETLKDVSQKYGIDLKYLAKINKIKSSKRLKRGQKIKLKPYSSKIDNTVIASTNTRQSKYLFDEPLTPND